MTIKIIKDSISLRELDGMAKESFGELVKIVVDIEQGIMAAGGDLHADEEALLIEQGSRQENLWGVNLYSNKSGDDWIEFDSMINLRPSQDNRSRSVESQEICERIRNIISRLIVR